MKKKEEKKKKKKKKLSDYLDKDKIQDKALKAASDAAEGAAENININLSAPDIDIKAPDIDIPDINIKAPDINVDISDVNLDVDMPDIDIDVEFQANMPKLGLCGRACKCVREGCESLCRMIAQLCSCVLIAIPFLGPCCERYTTLHTNLHHHANIH